MRDDASAVAEHPHDDADAEQDDAECDYDYDNNVDDLDVIDEEAAAIMTFIKFHPKHFVNLYSSCHDGQEYSNTRNQMSAI